MSEMVGASLTGVTVNKKSSLALSAPSLTVTVIVVAPDWLANGVTATVRLAPLPPNVMLPTGTNPGDRERVEYGKRADVGCRRLTMKASAPVAVSSLIV